MPDEPTWRRYRRFRGPNPRQDLDEELAFHIAMREDELLKDGHAPEKARELAMARFGNVEVIREECHELGARRATRRDRASRWDALRQDLRYSVRNLRTNAGFAVSIILTMALAIGATTAVFSVAYGVLLRPLPYRDADALVRLWSMNAERGLEYFSVSPADYRDWKSRSRAFSSLGVFERSREAVLLRATEPEVIEAAAVEPDVFALLGTSAAIGRPILDDDARPGAPATVLLSDHAWMNRFGSDRSIIGREITLDGVPHTVVGVMPPGFNVPGSSAELWTPLSLAGTSEDHAQRYLRVLGRLAPGIDAGRARSELELISAHIAVGNPGTNAGWSVNMMAVTEMIVGTQFRRAMLVLLGVVGFVLLIACANSANLQLARAATRERELAIRSTLGAGRARIASQLLAESALLVTIAGVLGLLIASAGLKLLRLVGTETVPRLEDVQLDAPVLAFTALVTLASGLVFGLFPAVRASRANLVTALKQGAPGGGTSAAGSRVRSALVVTQVMLSLILLVGTGLLMRSFVRLQRVELGFNSERIAIALLRVPEAATPEPAAATVFFETLVQQAAAVPGVTAAAAVSSAPFAGGNTGLIFTRVDRPVANREQAPDADFRVVTPGYFAALGMPLLRGRDFGATDAEGSPAVAIISQTMARRYWPDEEVLGARIRLGDIVEGPVVTVVGVAADVRYQTLETPDVRPMVYFAIAQRPQRSMTVVLRTSDNGSAAAGVRRAVATLAPGMPAPTVMPLERFVREASATRRFALVLFGIFAGVASILAGIGIYGVMSFLVRQRTHELGVRVALGAPQGRLLASVISRAMRLTMLGVVLGLLGAWYLSKSLSVLLFEVSATDGATFGAVAVFVIAIGLIASIVPARRAMRADPMEALRGEA